MAATTTPDLPTPTTPTTPTTKKHTTSAKNTDEKWPLLVEFPGNNCGPGGMPGPNGNLDCGSEWTAQGWGVGLGRKYVWLTLPFVTKDKGNETDVSMYWWGCSFHGAVRVFHHGFCCVRVSAIGL
jgi:hypothetical protein